MSISLEQKIKKVCRKADRLIAWGLSKIPDENLPLVSLEGLSDKSKLIIEKRLKGEKHA